MRDVAVLGVGMTRFGKFLDSSLKQLAGEAIGLATGVPLFSTRAMHYAHNTAFQIKVVLLAIAAVMSCS